MHSRHSLHSLCLPSKHLHQHNSESLKADKQLKLAPYIPEMKKNIARVLGIQEGQVNVKATTEEGLGFTGEGLGISASAVCLLSEIQN